MCTFKYNIVFTVIVYVLMGCAGTQKQQPVSPKPAQKTSFVPIQIPAKIDQNERTHFEKILLLLPTGHPQRIKLRNQLVASLVEEFEKTDPNKSEARLELFKNALRLHDPSDFKPESVATDLKPMAEWAIKICEARGEEATVMASLRFLMLVDPNSASTKESYLELVEWSERVRNTIENPIERLSSLIDMYRDMVKLVPDREVVERLAEAYIERHNTIAAAFRDRSEDGMNGINPYQALRQGQTLRTLPIDVIYIFFLAGDPAGARKHLSGLVADGILRVEFIELLDRIFQGIDPADSYFTLANYLAPVDARAGLRACIKARLANPKDPRFSLYIGRLFEELDQPENAFDFYYEAAEIAPEKEVVSEVLSLLRVALIKVHLKEYTEISKRAIQMGDSVIEKTMKSFKTEQTELGVNVASLLFAMGEVEFDDGRIDASHKHLEKSFQVMPNVPALVKLTEIQYLLGNYQEGMKTVKRAMQLESHGRRPSGYWRAVLIEKHGDLVQAMGQAEDAQVIYRRALQEWKIAQISVDQAPLVAMRRGVLYHQLGELEASQEAFRLAVRLDPDRHATYAQLISFLVVVERLEDALEFYQLAYNQDEIEGMWKIYYSLWVEGLAKRLGKDSIPLAVGYLKHSKGDSWQDKLAQFFSGTIPLEKLRKAARNVGQNVEADYYSSVLDISNGRIDDAVAKLNQVLNSKLLGFFEFKMARAILQGQLKDATNKQTEKKVP